MLSHMSTMSVARIMAQRPEYNAPLLNVMERNCQQDVMMIGDSVRIRDALSGTYMFSVGSLCELYQLMDDVIDKLDTFLINNADYKNEISRKFPKAVISEFNCYMMQKKDCIQRTEIIEGVETTSLDLGWLDFILEKYRDREFGNELYISDRILHGPGLGLRVQGEKAAFVLQHKDGESGPLVVDSRVRGMGLGSYLLKRFNRLLLKNNDTLYGFVKPENNASAHMMLSSGYKLTQNNVIWVYRMKNGTLYLP